MRNSPGAEDVRPGRLKFLWGNLRGNRHPDHDTEGGFAWEFDSYVLVTVWSLLSTVALLATYVLVCIYSLAGAPIN